MLYVRYILECELVFKEMDVLNFRLYLTINITGILHTFTKDISYNNFYLKVLNLFLHNLYYFYELKKFVIPIEIFSFCGYLITGC